MDPCPCCLGYSSSDAEQCEACKYINGHIEYLRELHRKHHEANKPIQVLYARGLNERETYMPKKKPEKRKRYGRDHG